MNVLTNPLLFSDLQGNIPPQWMLGQDYFFPGNIGIAQGLIYTGAAFKLPTSMTFSVTTTAGLVVPTLTVSVSGPSGETVTPLVLEPSQTITPTILLPDNATGLRFALSSASGPFTEDMEVTVAAGTAIDRIYPPNTMGRASTAYASGYYRDRVHVTQVYANEIRPLIANFGGALNKGRAIASATWDTYQGAFASLATPALTETTATVAMSAQYSGNAVIRCTATLDNGEKIVQQFYIDVLPAPVYQGEVYVTGPSRVTVEA